MKRLIFFFVLCLHLHAYEQKKVLVCGAGGFIGYHMAKYYKEAGYWVRGVDIKTPEFGPWIGDEFLLLDLRDAKNAMQALWLGEGEAFDEVCQLAANMGGMGFISLHDAEIMHDNVLINVNVLEACRLSGAKKIFFSSSACAYPERNQLDPNNPHCKEDSAYPAAPDTEYGWEKLFSERIYLAYARDYGMDIRIARLHNVFGPQGTWRGERAKAPAALCKKIAEAKDGGTVEIWGRGDQTRSFLYISECIEGIRRIMEAKPGLPVLNLGSEEMISIHDLTLMIAAIANKQVIIKNIPGPEGVRGRNSDNMLISTLLQWAPSQPLHIGMEQLYEWIEQQLHNGSEEVK